MPSAAIPSALGNGGSSVILCIAPFHLRTYPMSASEKLIYVGQTDELSTISRRFSRKSHHQTALSKAGFSQLG
jgi:hypothetical protein